MGLGFGSSGTGAWGTTGTSFSCRVAPAHGCDIFWTFGLTSRPECCTLPESEMESQQMKLASEGEGYRRMSGRASLPESSPTETKELELFHFVERADTFATKGITNESAATLGMTPAEFTTWSMTQGGHEAIQQAHLRLSSKLDARLTDLMDRLTNDIEVRIREGNKEYNRKTGEWDYVPLNGRDLAIIFGALFDRRQLLRKQPTKITEEDHKLTELTGTLRRIGTGTSAR